MGRLFILTVRIQTRIIDIKYNKPTTPQDQYTKHNEEHKKMVTDTKRLMSLDLFRGSTVALMILVNNPGALKSTYIPLKHALWIGFPAAELVFQFFLVIMGVSACIYITIVRSKYN